MRIARDFVWSWIFSQACTGLCHPVKWDFVALDENRTLLARR